MEDLKYLKSPKKDKKFKFYWDLFIPDVIERDNFKKGHLEQLYILCQLYVEFHNLSKIIEVEGYTYISETRNGTQQKISGNVLVRDKITSEIRQYSKLLKLVLEKDKPHNPDQGGEWE